MPRSIGPSLPGFGAAIRPTLLVALLATAAFATRLYLLASTPEPIGTDGYAYVVQLERLLSEGRLHFPDSSWVLRFFALFAIVWGPITGVKIGAALLAAACVPAGWWAGLRVRDDAGAEARAIAVAVWAAVSPSITTLAGDFPKELAIVAPLLAAFGAIRARRFVVAGVLLVVGATAHRVGAGLAALAILGAGLDVLRTRVPSVRGTVVGASAVLVFVALSVALPNLLRPDDLARLAPQLDFAWNVPAPWPWFELRSTAVAQQVELSLPIVVLVVMLLKRGVGLTLVVPLVVCVLPWWRTDQLDAGWRFALVAPAIAAVVAVHAWPARPVPVRLGAIAAVLVPLVVVLAPRGIDPAETNHDRERAIIARLPRPLPELLVVHQGFNFVYDHETGHDSLAWAPEPGLDRTRIWRLAWGIRPGQWLAAEDRLAFAPPLQAVDREYTLVREDAWEAFVAGADPDDDVLQDALRNWRNPHVVRPAAMLRAHAEQ